MSEREIAASPSEYDMEWARTYADQVTFGSYEQNTLLLARALAEHRRLIAGVAAERVRDLYEGANALAGDSSFAVQMVEALLIWQRITQSHRPKGVLPDLSSLAGSKPLRASPPPSVKAPLNDQ